MLIGQAAEQEAIDLIRSDCPEAVSLCGQTSIAEIASLARAACVAVGNDTGPMHIIAASGCPRWCCIRQSRIRGKSLLAANGFMSCRNLICSNWKQKK